MLTGNLTKYGSVREAEGTFYTQRWVEIFTPLTQGERQAFINAVGKAEAIVGRQLSVDELIKIVKRVGAGAA